MQITLTLELTKENLALLEKLISADAEPAKAPEKPKKEAKKPEPTKAAPEPVKEEPAAEAAPEAPKISKTDLRAVALKLSKAGKADELAKIFNEFGAENLSGIAEADYPAVMERLVSANA